VVTGGSRGIGAACVEQLAADGFEVLAVGRDADALAAVRDAQAAAGRTVREAVCDVTDEPSVAALFGELDPVAVLVNNAGISTSAPLSRTPLADWREQLEVNATGAFLCTRAIIDSMREAGRGRIVMVGSTAGLHGGRYTAAYSASKHALLGLMRSAAADLAGSGATANAVCPAYVRTEMTDRTLTRISDATGRTRDEALEAVTRGSPLRRLLDPGEVAAAVGYLCDDAASAVNGETIVLDGGAQQQ
jgi:NAD(P)-dependent dehydrogenase (short-subunit alcohol dehydrogenase family)